MGRILKTEVSRNSLFYVEFTETILCWKNFTFLILLSAKTMLIGRSLELHSIHCISNACDSLLKVLDIKSSQKETFSLSLKQLFFKPDAYILPHKSILFYSSCFHTCVRYFTDINVPTQLFESTVDSYPRWQRHSKELRVFVHAPLSPQRSTFEMHSSISGSKKTLTKFRFN